MRFPPSAYTSRGGVPTVSNANRAQWIAENEAEDAERGAAEVEVDALADTNAEADSETEAHAEEERLAA